MTQAFVEPTSSNTAPQPGRSRRGLGMMSLAVLAVVGMGLSSCGGGDDDDDASDSASTTAAVTVAPTTTAAAPTTTVPPTTTTTLDLVTEGATLIVANASGINGAAGRMSDELEIAGFSVDPATNSSEGQLETSKVYFDSDNPDAEEVADSVRLALGSGDIEVLEMGVPAPVESGEIGDATIVVAMGNDVADKSLAELQGRVAPAAEEESDETEEESDETEEESDETEEESDESEEESDETEDG